MYVPYMCLCMHNFLCFPVLYSIYFLWYDTTVVRKNNELAHSPIGIVRTMDVYLAVVWEFCFMRVNAWADKAGPRQWKKKTPSQEQSRNGPIAAEPRQLNHEKLHRPMNRPPKTDGAPAAATT